jgi:NPCBM/NEW2 domain
MSSGHEWSLANKIALGIFIGTVLLVGIGFLTFLNVGTASKPPKEPTSTTHHPPQNGHTESQPQPKPHPNPASFLDKLQITQQEGGEAEFGVAHVGPTRYRHSMTLPYSATNMFGPETITFALPGGYSTFRALVGFDPNATKEQSESMRVKVFTINKHAEVNTVVSPASPPCTIEAPTSGANTIEIETGPNNYGARIDVVLADPRVFAGTDFPNMPTAAPCP